MVKGIFLPSDDLDTSVMINYLQVLLNAFPSVKCTSVKADEKLKGFKVKFSEPEEDLVWKAGHITADNQQVVPIHPLTTTLWVSGKNKVDNDYFRNDLIEIINQKLGIRILCYDCLGKNYGFEKWIFKINLPELDASSIKKIHSALTLSLPLREVTSRIWCRKCNEPGHFYRECGLSATENQRISGDSKMETVNKNEVPCGSNNPNESNNGRYPIKDVKTKIEEEEILKKFLQLDLSETSKSRLTPKKKRTGHEYSLKKEVEDEQKAQPDGIGNNCKSDRNLVLKEPVAGASNMIPSENSSNDDDDDVSEDETSPSLGASRYSKVSRPDDAMLSEASRSPTTFKDESFSSASPGQAKKRAKPTSRVGDIDKLSSLLVSCINHACDTVKVLDKEGLKSFFIHVKNRTVPIRIAEDFTKDTDGLKKQLQAILKEYIRKPETGTKEDKQFITWLKNLIERFDGTTPGKEKPTSKNSGEPSSKK